MNTSRIRRIESCARGLAEEGFCVPFVAARAIARENCDNARCFSSPGVSAEFPFLNLASSSSSSSARTPRRNSPPTRSPWSHRVHFYDDGMQRSPAVLIYLGPPRSTACVHAVLRWPFFLPRRSLRRLRGYRLSAPLILAFYASTRARARLRVATSNGILLHGWECCFAVLLIAPRFHLQSAMF